MTPEERKIDKLQRQLESMAREITRLKAESSRKERHVRDSFLGSILGGLMVGWRSDCSPQAFADVADRVVEAVMRNRARWEAGISNNVAPKPPERPTVPVGPTNGEAK